MLAFLNLDVQELTVLLFFGWLVIMPLIVGIVALTVDCRNNRWNLPRTMPHARDAQN